MATNLFRQAALDRLSSPEQLDRALTVTTSKTWLALTAIAAMAAAAVAWSVVGQVPTYVQANGILLSHGGAVVDAVPSSVGTLSRIVAAVDDEVKEGETVAEITNREVIERHRGALALVKERERALAEFKEAAAEEDALIGKNTARQRRRLERIERSGRQQLEIAGERLENHRRLYEERIVTRVTVDRSQQAFDRAQRELFSTIGERDNLEAREQRRQNERRVRLAEREARLQAAERQANEIKTQLETQRVLAPVAGRVTEIKATIGAVLRPGQPVLSIKTEEGALGVLIYVPPAEGKKIEPGMEALVSPSTVRREAHGSLKGKVESVSSFPASQEGMIAVLQNRSLVQILSQDGAPYSGRVLLDPDPSTASGFAWTSPKASEETLTSGTLASIEIKTESQAPIHLVVPLLKETFGL